MNAELEAAGSPIRFETASADSEQSPEGAARAVEAIVQSTGAQVIIGPLTTSEVLGAKQFADENAIVLVSPTSSGSVAAIPDDNIFRVMYPPDTFASRAYAAIARQRAYDNVVALHIDDPFGNGLVEAFTSEFEKTGGTVISFSYAPDAANLHSEAAAIGAEIARLGDNTVFFCICFLVDAQRVMQLALVDPLLSSVEWMGIQAMTSAEILEDPAHAQLLADVNFISVSLSDTSTPLTQLFVDDFSATYDMPPGPFTNYAFDAANIAMLTMLAAGNDGKAVKSMLPFIANHYIGTSVQAFLDENGDQAIAIYGIYQLNSEYSDFEQIAIYKAADDSITYDR